MLRRELSLASHPFHCWKMLSYVASFSHSDSYDGIRRVYAEDTAMLALTRFTVGGRKPRLFPDRVYSRFNRVLSHFRFIPGRC